jgi:hypothetical protein
MGDEKITRSSDTIAATPVRTPRTFELGLGAVGST